MALSFTTPVTGSIYHAVDEVDYSTDPYDSKNIFYHTRDFKPQSSTNNAAAVFTPRVKLSLTTGNCSVGLKTPGGVNPMASLLFSVNSMLEEEVSLSCDLDTIRPLAPALGGSPYTLFDQPSLFNLGLMVSSDSTFMTHDSPFLSDLQESGWPFRDPTEQLLPSTIFAEVSFSHTPDNFIDSLFQSPAHTGLASPKTNTSRPGSHLSPHKFREASPSRKQKGNLLKNSRDPLNIICGKNITVANSLHMAETMIVGHARGKYPNSDGLDKWVSSNW